MDVSVVVCTKERKGALTNLISSLCKQTRLPDELIIVDASRHDDTKEMLAKINNRLSFDLIYERTVPGLTRQRNIGADLSHGTHLFFFDDDVVLDPEYIRVVENTFNQVKDKQLGGLTGRIVNIDPQLKVWDRFFRSIFFLNDYGKGIIKLSGFPSHMIGAEPAFVEILSGCNMIYPKKIFFSSLLNKNQDPLL